MNNNLFKTLQTLQSDESGATAIEYGLISGSMALALITAMPFVSVGTTEIFGYITELFDL